MEKKQKFVSEYYYRMKKKIKICHIVSGDLWAGAEAQLTTTLECLLDYEILDISVIVLNEGVLANKLQSLGIKVYIIDEKKNSFLKIIYKVFKLFNKIQPHIVHSHRYKENLITAILGILFRKMKQIRTQHTTFTSLGSQDNIKMWIYRKIDMITATLFADKVIAVSEAIYRQVSDCTRADRAVTIHNYVDPEKIRKAAEYQEAINWDTNDAFFIGTAGRLVDIKGLKYLVNAAKIICEEISNIKFIIAGTGPLYSELEKQIQDYKLVNKVILTGFRKDIISIINKLDVFIMPSLYEGIPMALLEAMALGKPVIASNVGGIPEIIENKISGILIEPEDEQIIFDECINLYKNKELRNKLGANAFKRIKGKFYSQSKIEQLLSVYTDIMSVEQFLK